MQGIYTYISETHHIPKEYNVAAILSLLFMVPISLAPALALMYFYIITFRSMCAVPNMAVFCSSLISVTLLLLLLLLLLVLNNFLCVFVLTACVDINVQDFKYIFNYTLSGKLI
jgi:hypothetical protein